LRISCYFDWSGFAAAGEGDSALWIRPDFASRLELVSRRRAEVILSEGRNKGNFRHLLALAVEHYEIARYGTLIAWADQLGMKDASKLLRQTLDEEKRRTNCSPSSLWQISIKQQHSRSSTIAR
jgi:Domain of unknown function (DUF892)